MLALVIIFLLLQVPVSVCDFSLPRCFPRSVHQEGDVIIGGLFPLYIYMDTNIYYEKPVRENFIYPEMTFSNYHYVLAFIFAIEEINRNLRLLPNISLGYEFHNIQHSQWRILENILLILKGQDEMPNYNCQRESKSVAVLTGTSGAASAQGGMLLSVYRIPQLTYGSFDPMLSDGNQFPSLYQVAPKDTHLSLGIVSMLVHFNWTWVGLVIPEDQNGFQFLSDLTREMDRNKVCLAFVKIITTDPGLYFSRPEPFKFLSMGSSVANVLILYFESDGASEMGFYSIKYSMAWKVLVTNSEKHAATTGKDFILDLFHGTFIFSHHRKKISAFQKFVQSVHPSKYAGDTYLALLWVQKFGCSLSDSDCAVRNCPPNASLAWLPANAFEMVMTDEDYNIYNAVYAVARALHDSLLQRVQEQQMENEGMMFSPWKLHPFLKNTQFTNPAGNQLDLDENGGLDADYDILNFWNFPDGLRLRMKIGEFSLHALRGQQLSLFEDMIEWAMATLETPRSVCSESCHPGFRKSLQEGQPACCFDCTPCPEDQISNDTDMEQCVSCPDHQYANIQREHCLQKSVTFLSYEDPLGKALAGTVLIFTFLTAAVLGLFIMHRETPIVKANNKALSYTLLISLTFCFLCSLLFIGRPDTATCILQQTTFALVFTVAVSTVLAKTVTVVLAFKVTAPGRRMRRLLVSGAPNAIIPICSLIQLTLCAVWMGTNPPYTDTDAHSEHGHIIIVCNKGSLTAFYCVLGYLGSLALASFTVAFLARNLPDTFNEAKFLTFSMLVFCSVWVTFLPVYHSSKGRVMVAMEVFSILASSAGLLGCIFAPKCYIILLRPKRNSLHSFREKL